MKVITVYTTEPCGFCRQVKALLDKHSIAYTEINLSKDPAGRAELAQLTGMMTFPQVLVDGVLLGGFSETLAAERSGQLDELLAA